MKAQKKSQFNVFDVCVFLRLTLWWTERWDTAKEARSLLVYC